jgi:hypothetical protein
MPGGGEGLRESSLRASLMQSEEGSSISENMVGSSFCVCVYRRSAGRTKARYEEMRAR